MGHVTHGTIASGPLAAALAVGLCIGPGTEVAVARVAAVGATAANATAANATAAEATAASVAQTEPATVPAVAAPGVVQELELRDGSRLFGRVESVDSETFVFRLVTGPALVIARADVIGIRIAQGIANDGQFLPADPNATRLFFGPTGRALHKGEGYFGVYQVLLPFVQVGVTDRVSFGGGTPLVFGGDGGHPVWLTPKLQLYSTPRVQAAAGVMQVLGVDGGYAGIAYGVATIGSGNGAVSVGAGWGYDRGNDDEGDTPIVMIGAERRVSRRVKWITENYVFRDGGILTGGVRFIGDRLSADVALAAPLGTDGLFVWPVVNFVWVFDGFR